MKIKNVIASFLLAIPAVGFANAPMEKSVECLKASAMPKDMDTWKQVDFDRLFPQLDTGVIPDGPLDGTVVYSDEPTVIDQIDNELQKRFLLWFGPRVWQGKKFYADEGILWNRVIGLERFPAYVYEGKSVFDPDGAPSIMINYADGDQIDGYKKIDEIFTKAKLNVLDEIREVRPGFYLGRSNIKNQFALNFTL